ncbi:MAG: hypothetical protein RBR06_01865 [Desulfuromonadaceae bacterium]|nr:hypothetical protein [Desulfuromonadaceae bacterium]
MKKSIEKKYKEFVYNLENGELYQLLAGRKNIAWDLDEESFMVWPVLHNFSSFGVDGIIAECFEGAGDIYDCDEDGESIISAEELDGWRNHLIDGADAVADHIYFTT